MAADFRAAVRPEALARLAAALGLSVASLTRLGVGWSAKHRAWTFPMVDVDGHVLGIRLRRAGGKKTSVRGGHDGLFLPVPEAPDLGGRLLVCEGPTDTAAALDLGFDAVGRPSCLGGVKLLVELVQRMKPADVVIVGDGDAPGQRGAESLASVLTAYCPAVRIITPAAPFKDARAWRQGGATAADVSAAIDVAPARRLVIKTSVRTRRVGGHHGRR